MRWPGKIEAGSVLNGIVSHIDMFPTLLAVAGDPDVTTKLLNGATVGDKTFKVHLDGYNMVPYLTGEVKESPRNAIFYFSDDGDVIAVRVGDYKFHLAEQRANRMRQWQEPFVKLRTPTIMNLAPRPVRAGRLQLEHVLRLDGRSHSADVSHAEARGGADQGLRSFPPRQKPASFNLDAVMAQVTLAPHNAANTGDDGGSSKLPPSTTRPAARDRTRNKAGQP